MREEARDGSQGYFVVNGAFVAHWDWHVGVSAGPALTNGIRLRIKTHSYKHRLIGGKKVVIQSAVGGSAGLRFLHFLLGRRERRG